MGQLDGWTADRVLAESRSSGRRSIFRKTGWRRWSEVSGPTGEGAGDRAVFSFAEVDRSETSVLLRDASRGLDIALDLGGRQVLLKRAGADDARLYEVTWIANDRGLDRATLMTPGRTCSRVTATTGGVRVSNFRQTAAADWVELGALGNGAVRFRFVEERREDWKVHLLDSARGVRLLLDLKAAKVRYRTGTTPYSDLYDVDGVGFLPPAAPGAALTVRPRRRLLRRTSQLGLAPDVVREGELWTTFTAGAEHGGTKVKATTDKWDRMRVTPSSITTSNGEMVALSVASGEVIGVGVGMAFGIGPAIVMGGMTVVGVLAGAGIGLLIAVPIAVAAWPSKTVVLVANELMSDLRVVDVWIEQGQMLHTREVLKGAPGETQIPARPGGDVIEGLKPDYGRRPGTTGWGYMESVPSIGTFILEKVFGFDGIGVVITLEDADGRRYRVAVDNRPYGSDNSVRTAVIDPGATSFDTPEKLLSRAKGERRIQHSSATNATEPHRPVAVMGGLGALKEDTAIVLVRIHEGNETYLASEERRERVLLCIAEGRYAGRFLRAGLAPGAAVTLTPTGATADDTTEREWWEVIAAGELSSPVVSYRSVATGGWLSVFGSSSSTQGTSANRANTFVPASQQGASARDAAFVFTASDGQHWVMLRDGGSLGLTRLISQAALITPITLS